MMSLKTRVDALAFPPTCLFMPTFEHYVSVWNDGSIMTYASNSLIVAPTSTALGMLLGVPAGYALARIDFPGRRFLLLAILSTRMIPPVASVIPFFVIFSTVGLKDTYTGLVIVYLTIILGFVIWMMRSYFIDIPRELEEAAMIDGCGRGARFGVVLPVSLAGAGDLGDLFVHLLLERISLRDGAHGAECQDAAARHLQLGLLSRRSAGAN